MNKIQVPGSAVSGKSTDKGKVATEVQRFSSGEEKEVPKKRSDCYRLALQLTIDIATVTDMVNYNYLIFLINAKNNPIFTFPYSIQLLRP